MEKSTTRRSKEKPKGKGQQPRLTSLPLAQVAEWSDNPKLHDIARLKESLREFGFVAPVVIDTYNEHLIAGHGRVAALKEMRDANEKPPERIEERGGDWLVPALVGAFFGSKEQAEAYGVADNRLVELGGWKDPELLAMLQAIRAEDGEALVDAIGYPADTVRLLEQIAIGAEGMLPDRLAEMEAGTSARPGKIVLVYGNRKERREWLQAIGVEAKWDGVILTVNDLK
jgi:hypothetical protein